jgi:hypothetical protein
MLMKNHIKFTFQRKGNILPCLMMVFHLLSLVFFSVETGASVDIPNGETSIFNECKKQFVTPYIEFAEEEINEDDHENDQPTKRKNCRHIKSNGLFFLVLDQYFNIQKSTLQSFPIRSLHAPSGLGQLILFHQFKIDF